MAKKRHGKHGRGARPTDTARGHAPAASAPEPSAATGSWSGAAATAGSSRDSARAISVAVAAAGATPFGPSASAPPDTNERAGFVELAQAGVVLAVAMALSYATPGLERFRPWEPGEPVPIVHLFLGDVDDADAERTTSPVDDEALARLADDVVAPPPPVVERDPEVVVAPEELEGLTQRIEDDGGAMDAFYAALLRTARGEAGAITRVAHFGDSTIALDGITETVREDLQARFGDAGHGFVLAARGSLPYRHHDVRHESEGSWRIQDITHLSVADGRYGLGGVQARAVTNASAWVATDDDDDVTSGNRVSRFDVFYQRHDRGGHFRWRVDEGEWSEVDARADETRDEVLSIPVDDGPHRLDLRASGHGETRLYGVVLERDGPGVVYDSLGMVGARAARMMGFAPEHLAAQLAARGTNLVVVGFGGNDADDERSTEDFEEIFREVARLVRTARPEASCLLFAPIDQAERDARGRVRTLATVERIVTGMRNAARAEGCAFFDTWTAMGGEGAMGRWFRMSPRLSSGDFRHATPAGYRVVGGLFYRALLAGLADYAAADGAADHAAAIDGRAP